MTSDFCIHSTICLMVFNGDLAHEFIEVVLRSALVSIEGKWYHNSIW